MQFGYVELKVINLCLQQKTNLPIRKSVFYNLNAFCFNETLVTDARSLDTSDIKGTENHIALNTKQPLALIRGVYRICLHLKGAKYFLSSHPM